MAGPGAYSFGDEERKEVMDVLASGHLSRYGSTDDDGYHMKVYKFEQEFASYCGSKYAIATSSGTSALLVSLLSLGIGDGDEVLVPGYTFVASIGSIIYARATPVLVEIDESLTMDPVDLENKITARTKAIMAVHMLGNPCNMSEIMRIAKKHDLMVIEDGCQAAGAEYGGKKVGTFGKFGAFSLNRYKNMAAGDGGVIVTDDLELYQRAYALHDQGHTPNRSGKDASGLLVGLNFKMNELTGAVALAQTRKLDGMLTTLRQKKSALKQKVATAKWFKFRTLNDEEGECGTLLSMIFESKKNADYVADKLGGRTLLHSGWHVYSNMPQIAEHRTPSEGWSEPARFANPGDLPRTEDILGRTVSLSVGVVDGGLGAGYGINILSTDTEIEAVAEKFIDACKGIDQA